MQKTAKRKPSKSEVIGEILDLIQGLFSWWDGQGFWQWQLSLDLGATKEPWKAVITEHSDSALL